MDCSICFEAITKETGSTTLSCEHVYHFRCIDSWFTKQICEDLPQTCPCCRNGGCEMDRCSVIELDEEEEDDDFEDEESETASEGDNESVATMRWERIGDGRWMVCSSSSLAHENLRSLFGPLNDLDAEEPDAVASATI